MAVNRPQLRVLTLNVTARCDAACLYCQWWQARAGDPDLEWLLEYVREAAALGSRLIRISGGEPLLREDLPRIVRAIKAEGMTAMVCTSGRKPLLHLRKLVEAGLDLMAISLDVLDPACFRQLRGYELQPVLENLEGLARLRNRLDFQIVLSVVLTPLNIDLLEKVADLAQRLDLLVSVAPVQNGRQREDSLAVSLAFEPADEGRVAAAVAGLKAAGRRGVKLVNSDAFLDGIGRFLVHRRLPEGYRCRAGEFSGILMTDGGLKLCHSLEPLGGGTLVEQWLGREAELLRRRMARLDCPRCWLSCHVDERRPGVWVSGGTEGRQVR